MKVFNELRSEKIRTFWPIGFIFIVWFVFCVPYFFQHKVPFPSKYQVTFFTPWNQYQEFAGPVKNGAMSDVINQIYPWKHLTIETFKSGQLPLWNPYSFAGTPHLANYQSAVLSPFNVLFLILPFLDAWSVLVLLQPLLAGLFMYLFLRALAISRIGSVLGSIAYMFCGFIVVWMAYGTLSMAVAFLPLILFSIEKSFHSKILRGKNFVFGPLLLSLSLAISFFSGHVQMSIYVALYVFFYIIFKYFTTKNISLFLLTILFYIFGIGISLLQILPTLELYSMSSRSELFSNAGAIPLDHLVTVFAPDFFGNPVTRNDWIGYYAEWASFIGIVPLFLAIVALTSGKKRKIVFFFFFSGILTLLLAHDTPLQEFIRALKLPIFSTSIPSRIIALFSFSFVVLAGLGFDAFMNLIEKKQRKKMSYPFIIISLFLACIWIMLLVFKVFPADKIQIATRNLVLPSFFFCLIVAGTVITVIAKKKKIISALIWILVMVTMIDSLRFAMKWMPFDPRELVFPQTPVVDAMQKQIEQGRVYGDFGAFVDTYYHLPGIDGYDPLFNKRYGEFIQSAGTGQFTNAQRSIVSLDKRGKYADRVLDLLGVTLIYHPISNTNQSWAYPVWKDRDKYELTHKDDKFQVFKNKTALPRASMFYNYEVVNYDKEIIKRFYGEQFDFRNTVILEENPKLTKNKEQKTKNKVEIVSYTPNKVVVSVTTEKPGLLFLSDTYYPKWKVKVNGHQEKMYRADYVFRGVVVPEGTSMVEYYYSGLF